MLSHTKGCPAHAQTPLSLPPASKQASAHTPHKQAQDAHARAHVHTHTHEQYTQSKTKSYMKLYATIPSTTKEEKKNNERCDAGVCRRAPTFGFVDETYCGGGGPVVVDPQREHICANKPGIIIIHHHQIEHRSEHPHPTPTPNPASAADRRSPHPRCTRLDRACSPLPSAANRSIFLSDISPSSRGRGIRAGRRSVREARSLAR